MSNAGDRFSVRDARLFAAASSTPSGVVNTGSARLSDVTVDATGTTNGSTVSAIVNTDGALLATDVDASAAGSRNTLSGVFSTGGTLTLRGGAFRATSDQAGAGVGVRHAGR